MINMTIDLSEMIDIGDSIEDAILTSMQNTLSVAKYEWQRRAQSELRTTRLDYLLGLTVEDAKRFDKVYNGSIGLNGTLANMIESGFGSFDEKIGFAKSSRKHASKNGGWYLTIPFRHGIPNTTSYNPMPNNIYAKAKKLKSGQSLSIQGGQKTSWTGYQHKNNIYDGLKRVVKSYNSASQSQYMTFRRVSDKSAPSSWQHPGYKGVKIANQIEPLVMNTLQRELTNNLNKVLS